MKDKLTHSPRGIDGYTYCSKKIGHLTNLVFKGVPTCKHCQKAMGALSDLEKRISE